MNVKRCKICMMNKNNRSLRLPKNTIIIVNNIFIIKYIFIQSMRIIIIDVDSIMLYIICMYDTIPYCLRQRI